MLAIVLSIICAAPAPALALAARAESAMVDKGAALAGYSLTLEVESRWFASGEAEIPEGPPAFAALRSDRLELRLDGSEARRKVHVATPDGGVVDYQEQLGGGDAAEARAFERTLGMFAPWLMAQITSKRFTVKATPKLALDGRKLPALAVKTPDGLLTVAFDPDTGLPLVVRRVVSHPLRGRRMYELRYTEWRPAGPLRVPKAWTTSLGGEAIAYSTVRDASAVKARATSGKPSDAPPAAAEADIVRAMLAPTGGEVGARQWQRVSVAEGVDRLSGRAGDILVVEMRDHLVVFDAPCAGACADAALAELRRAYPKKPVRTLVLSHHHDARALGLLSFALAVDQIIVAAGARAWTEKLLQRLPKKRRPVVLDVAPQRAITDGTRVVRLTRLVDHPHASTLIMGYVQDAKVLWAVDVAVGRDHPLHFDWNERLRRAERSLGVGASALVVDGRGSVAPHTPLASVR